MFSKTARKRQIGPNGLLASTARTFSNTCVFAVFCSFRLYVVIGALPAPSLHQNELFASTACTFSNKARDFDDFCEDSALRRDWRSSAHLLEGLGPHASDPGWPKWFPQAPLRPRRTTQRTVVTGGQRPDYLKTGFLRRRRAHFQTRVFLMIFVKTQPNFVIRVCPAPSFGQYGLLASTACTFLRRLMLIVFGCFLKNCVPLQREAPFGSPGLSP